MRRKKTEQDYATSFFPSFLFLLVRNGNFLKFIFPSKEFSSQGNPQNHKAIACKRNSFNWIGFSVLESQQFDLRKIQWKIDPWNFCRRVDFSFKQFFTTPKWYWISKVFEKNGSINLIHWLYCFSRRKFFEIQKYECFIFLRSFEQRRIWHRCK